MGLVSEKTVAQAEDELKKAKDTHEKAEETLAAAKLKAGKAGVKFKATAKAIEGIKRETEMAKLPVADDDLKQRPKRSAVDWAQKAAEERLVAYRDHMESAHAADREAAASQALLDTEEKVSQLEREVESDKIKINELKGVVKEARFDAEEVKARGKFTTRGDLAKLKYEQINEKNDNEVNSEEQELTSARKKLMISQRALAELKGGGGLEQAQEREKQALAELAQADAQARIATERVMTVKEKADKVSKLVMAKNEKKKAEKAVKAKKAADALAAAHKHEQDSDAKVQSAEQTLEKVKVATEKGEKSSAQAKIASEKAKKAGANKKKLQQMKAKEGAAKSDEKKKKSNEQQAKKDEKQLQAKEKSAKATKKEEIEVKTAAAEKTQKGAAKEKAEKSTKMQAAREADAKKDKKEQAAKAKAAKDQAAEDDKIKEAAEKSKAASASGTPCDTCMAKCTTAVCRTWCNAHWCEGKKGDSHKKELKRKLKVAKTEQRSAAKAMSAAKQQLDLDVKAEKTASGNAQSALAKAAETGNQQDVKEAQEDTTDVVKDQKTIKADKFAFKKDKATDKTDKAHIQSLQSKAYPPQRMQDAHD